MRINQESMISFFSLEVTGIKVSAYKIPMDGGTFRGITLLRNPILIMLDISTVLRKSKTKILTV